MIIDIIFAIINTAVLCAIFYYVYLRFVKERLQQGMILEQSTHMNMVRRQESLRKQEQSLVRAYYHHHYRYEELSHKIQKWRQHIDNRLQEQQHEAERLSQRIEQSRRERDRAVQERIACMKLIDHIVAETENRLVERCKDTTTIDHYLQHIVQSHGKGSV